MSYENASIRPKSESLGYGANLGGLGVGIRGEAASRESVG
jgi:hypothetical protein